MGYGADVENYTMRDLVNIRDFYIREAVRAWRVHDETEAAKSFRVAVDINTLIKSIFQDP